MLEILSRVYESGIPRYRCCLDRLQALNTNSDQALLACIPLGAGWRFTPKHR